VRLAINNGKLGRGIKKIKGRVYSTRPLILLGGDIKDFVTAAKKC